MKKHMALTEQQQAVVDNRGGNLLVAAAAGSGKTKVLVDRIMSRVCNEQIPITKFLMITYTRAAAAELRAKITTELATRLATNPGDTFLQQQLRLVYAAQISTVHAFCGNLLHSYAAEAGLSSDFRVGEEQECQTLKASSMEDLLESVYKTIASTPDIKAFIEELAYGRDDSAVPAILYDVYDTIQAHPWPGQWVADCMDTMDVARYKDAAETPWGAYIMRSIKGYVSSQLSLVEKAQKACATDEALSAAYTATLTSDAARMSDILAANTWDALYSAGVSGAWARLGRIKKDATYSERLQEYIKALRDRYKKAIDGKCKAVYGLSSEVLDDLKKTESSVRGMFALVAQFSARYTAKKTAHGILDFNDLEHETINLLLTTKTHEQTPIALDITKQYAEIMVDEYQDSNAVQEAIFNAVSTGSNRFMVGDVKQSIYMFRLADPTIFLNHYNAYGDYRTVSDGAPRKIILSKNFRSRPEILNATNAVMSACMSPSVGGINYDATESLMPGREDFTPSATPVVELNVIDMDDIHTDDDTESLAKVDVEAKYVAERIKTMLDTETIMDDETGTMRPILASDIAILMRSTRNSARHYTKALTELGISSKSTRGGSLLDTSEIATLYSYLQIIDNPMQDIPLVAVMASPLVGFTANTLAAVKKSTKDATSFFDALNAYSKSDEMGQRFTAQLESLRAMAPHTTLSRLFSEIIIRTDAEDVFGAMTNGEQRIANVHAFAEIIAQYEGNGARGLFEFLCYIESLRDQGIELPQPMHCAAEDAVSILSIHASKGLEYPIVFLSDLSRRFNQNDLKASALLHKDLGAGVQVVDKELMYRYPTIARSAIATCVSAETKSEELRILYVAMTRAKQKLVMTFCDKLQSTLQRLVADATMPLALSTAQAVTSPGEWVLLTALTREESAPLHKLTDSVPSHLLHDAYPWEINVMAASELHGTHHTMEELEADAEMEPIIDDGDAVFDALDADALTQDLDFTYPQLAATTTPAKLVATQSLEKVTPVIKIRRPDFAQARKGFSAAERGTATHLFMQYANFNRCVTEGETGIRGELSRMVGKKLIMQEQADAIQVTKLTSFFTSDAGRELATLPTGRTKREFPFSVLIPANTILGDAATTDKVLVQGIIDLFTITDDGIILYDFKTDWVADEADASHKASEYKYQLQRYGDALSCIYTMPVLSRKVVFLSSGDAIVV